MKINVVYELLLLAKLTTPERDINFQFFEEFPLSNDS
jgi:hypothetical protein